MKDLSIKIEDLGKEYKLGNTFNDNLRGSISSKIKSLIRPAKTQSFWALQGISFDVPKGEVVGVIGRNGAGKSTLLKILSRITDPSTGKITIEGRVSSLLEVGTGFHPELSGRENIFLNGTILGMTRSEIRQKFEEIVEFSGIEKFIDTAVKHYSSGMKVRLAFSVAAHLDPEILLIDEVLAVGDAEFQKKCLGKMEDVAGGGRTILFVSHNLGIVQSLCNKTAYLENGRLNFYGDTSRAIEKYITSQEVTTELSEISDRSGSGNIRFESVEFLDQNNQITGSIVSGMNLRIKLNYSAVNLARNVIVRLQVVSWDGYILFTCNNFHSSSEFSEIPGSGSFVCEIPSLPLNSGEYRLNLQCLENRTVADELEHISPFSVEPGNYYETGKLPSVKQGVLVKHKWTVA